MQSPHSPEVSLCVVSQPSFLALAVSFADTVAQAYGFGEAERHRLELSAEEIFTWLCRILGRAEPVEIRAHNGIYRLTLEYLFRPSALNLRVLNLTAKPPTESGEGIEDLGLFVVARTVDSLTLTRQRDGRADLTVVVERRYEETPVAIPAPGTLVQSWQFRPAGREDIQFFAVLVRAYYATADYPRCLNFPGQAADMLAAGDLHAALAGADGDALCGGVLWQWISDQMIELLGPFVFPPGQPPALTEALIEQVIIGAAKTTAIGILCRREAGQPVPDGFDLLGTIHGRSTEPLARDQVWAVRQLHEDEGAAVCCHPMLEAFLRGEYERLALPRQLRVIPFAATGNEPSVLTCATDRARGQVWLKALCFGPDAAANLREHLALFAEQHPAAILFELDLGVPWQSAFAPALLETGFVPRMVVPCAGQGDTVIFQKA